MTGLPSYANPAEAPDWMREHQACRQIGVETIWHGPHHPVHRPVYRVPARSAPMREHDFITMRFKETK